MTGPGNNTWLLMGAEPTLIDAGVGAPAHLEAIARAVEGRELSRALVTHGHADHASGAPALKARWPNVELAKFAPWDGLPWRALDDGDRIAAGDSLLTVIHTPGHALDHVCFWNPDTRELFAGDMLSLGTTIMIPAGRGGGLRAYLESLERLAALGPARVFPGHGTIIEKPMELIAEYLAHRRMREEQVRQCLAQGLTDAGAIVERLYPDLPAGLVAAARATIEAHIEKLREDGL
jgi:glyoxylase-like metal-dependent hydrolase (beta-lactamase superfamily II)